MFICTDSSLANAPIILGNSPSSGSTLLRVLLSRLASISSGGELAILDKPHLFSASSGEYRRNIIGWAKRGYPSGFVGPSEVIFTNLADYGWTRKEVLQLCQRTATYGELIRHFFARNVERDQKRRWLEKTPGNVFAFEVIENVFPTARFVHIIRDGRDCVASLARRGHRPFKAVSRWFYATLTGIQYRGRDNYYELRYEDLVRRSEEELRKLCDFLGEPFEERIIDGEANSSRCITTWRHSQQGDVSAASVGRHRQELTEDQRSLFGAVRLSDHGRRSLPFGETSTSRLSALELQTMLGYSADGLTDAPRLTLGGRLSAAKEVFRSQMRVFWKYRRTAPCATILSP